MFPATRGARRCRKGRTGSRENVRRAMTPASSPAPRRGRSSARRSCRRPRCARRPSNARAAEERGLAGVAGARVDLHAPRLRVNYSSVSSCRIRSFTTISARSGITSQAMLRTTWSDISCTTRRAMRSICSSVRSVICGLTSVICELTSSVSCELTTSSVICGFDVVRDLIVDGRVGVHRRFLGSER